MIFEIHFSKDASSGKSHLHPSLQEELKDLWRYEKIEAENEEAAIAKLKENTKVNYVLSATPIG